MNVSRTLVAATALILGSSGGPAWGQSAPRSHFGRTSSGMEAGAPVPTRTTAAVAARRVDDPLAPYTSRPRGATSGTPIATLPEQRQVVAPAARNYFPAARPGQVRHHCTPSRASALGPRR